jgi:hypothetical protein
MKKNKLIKQAKKVAKYLVLIQDENREIDDMIKIENKLNKANEKLVKLVYGKKTIYET